MIGKDDSAAGHVFFHQVDQVIVHFALYLVQNGDPSAPTVHTKRPPDFLGEFPSEVPPPSPNFRLINLYRSAQPDVWQHASVHVVVTSLAKE